MCTFKNLEENWKTWKKIEKTSGNPVCMPSTSQFLILFIYCLLLEKCLNIKKKLLQKNQCNVVLSLYFLWSRVMEP